MRKEYVMSRGEVTLLGLTLAPGTAVALVAYYDVATAEMVPAVRFAAGGGIHAAVFSGYKLAQSSLSAFIADCLPGDADAETIGEVFSDALQASAMVCIKADSDALRFIFCQGDEPVTLLLPRRNFARFFAAGAVMQACA